MHERHGLSAQERIQRYIPDVRACPHSHPRFLLVIMARYSRVLPGLEARWSPILYGNRGFLRVGSTSQERAAPLHPSLRVPLRLPSCSEAMGSTFQSFHSINVGKGEALEVNTTSQDYFMWTSAGPRTNVIFSFDTLIHGFCQIFSVLPIFQDAIRIIPIKYPKYFPTTIFIMVIKISISCHQCQ